jgi:multisubunit Na+/H+ antiporter MnhB subunit
MKKSLIVLSIASLLVLPFLASAIDFTPPSGTIGSVPNLVNAILTPVWQVFIGLAVIMVIVAGILFLTAMGSPEKVQTARQALIWGIIGIIVGVLAFSITAIIKMAVGG